MHILLAPGVNIYRAAYCGRNFEYAGEDPFLSSRFGVEYIRGVQDQGVSATVKHFAVNFMEYARHTASSDLDERTLHEIYLPAFKAAVTEARLRSPDDRLQPGQWRALLRAPGADPGHPASVIGPSTAL